jgi:hypothetical protein
MNKLIFGLAIFYTLNAAGQSDEKTPYPKSIIDIGVGVGPNYGIVGGQMVIGYKGCGLLLALGSFDGLNPYAFGFQVSEQWFFASFSRAVIGSSTWSNNHVEPIMGNILMLGGRINLIKAKTLVFQIGVGYRNSTIETPFGKESNDGITFGLGLGYRIAFKKAESATRDK